MYDPTFVAAVHADPDRALGAAGLEPAERAWVVGVDRRAWGTDPLRRRRTLRTLVEELKVSTTLALAETRSLSWLEGYFSSDEFHAAVSERRSIALGLCDFLAGAVAGGRLRTPQLADVVRLERTTAACRRAAGTPAPPSAVPPSSEVVRLAPGHAVGAFEANVIDTIAQVERYLFEVGLMPQVALCDDAPRLGELPPVATEQVHLLFFPNGASVGLSYLDPGTFAILGAAAEPIPRSTLARQLTNRGLPADAVEEALDSFLEEGILMGTRSPPPSA